jgi:ABC-2 type transport system ATP-binding protein
MIIALTDAAIGHGLGAAVPPVTLRIAPDVPTAIAVETDERPLVMSMLLGGRIQPDHGTVTIDGRHDLDDLRRATALVDTPFVAEPPAGISLASVVAEEFSFAGLSTSRAAVNDFLGKHHIADYSRVAIRALPPTERVRLFSELALLRDGVEALIITSPERHGGNPEGWYSVLAEIAARGLGVAIVTDAATRDILVRLGARDASQPAEPTSPVEPAETPETPAPTAEAPKAV